MASPEPNPYESVLLDSAAPPARRGRLSVQFVVGDERQLLQAIRSSTFSEAAESIGCFTCLLLLTPAVALAAAYSQLLFVLAGYVAGAIAGFIVREFAIRRISRRVLAQMQRRTGIEPGVECQLTLTATKLVTMFGQRRLAWPLRDTLCWKVSDIPKEATPYCTTIVHKRDLILRIPADADFGDSNPEEFVRLLQQRRTFCRMQRSRRRWARLRRLWVARQRHEVSEKKLRAKEKE